MRERYIDRYCAALDETKRTTPFGPHTIIWTVRDHVFAAYTVGGAGVSLRAEDRAQAHRLVADGKAIRVEYLREGVWVLLAWSTPPDELRFQIFASYELVAATAG
jgi:predicted DNA-binding protein (MmcQ/YjbR family)